MKFSVCPDRMRKPQVLTHLRLSSQNDERTIEMSSQKFTPVLQRVLRRVEKIPFSGCWIWLGATGDWGHGIIGLGARGQGVARTHRVTYEHMVGKIPAGKIVRHKCDVPCCVNPDHLELGEQKDNVNDMMSRGRHKVVLKPRKTYHRSSPKTIALARQLLKEGLSQSKVAAQVGLTKKSVGRIARGETWR